MKLKKIKWFEIKEKLLITLGFKKPSLFQSLFTISIFIKGIDGILEFAGGMTFVFLKTENILNLIWSTSNLFNIPSEKILHWMTVVANELTTNVHILVALILIVNGAVKIMLSINLLLRNLVAFPIALVFLIVLFLYQLVQTYYKPTLFFYVLDALDLMVIILIAIQYIELKKKKRMF